MNIQAFQIDAADLRKLLGAKPSCALVSRGADEIELF